MKFNLVSNKKEPFLDNNRVVEMKDNQVFEIKVHNPLPRRLQIDIFMNGKVGDETAFVGSFILLPSQDSFIKRGVNSKAEFTFKTNKELDLTKLINTSENDWGLVSIRFRDEDLNIQQYKSYNIRSGVKSCSLGGIVGGQDSSQVFITTTSIEEYGNVDEIYAVRIIEKKNKFSNLSEKSIPYYDYP